MKFELPQLNYEYNALEPYIDEMTMRVHHSKHHQGYMDKFQAAVDGVDALKGMTAEEILTKVDRLGVTEDVRMALKNNGGGYVNHNLFFSVMGPEKQVDVKLKKEIKVRWGSVDKFKEEFSTLAGKHFGSGWAWLVRDGSGELQAYTLANQESPLSRGHKPIFNLDIWEHAYYLKYQNRRPEYIENWWQVLKFL